MQRQYSRTAGRFGNRQVHVLLAVAGVAHALAVHEMHLLKEWAGDAKRREAARLLPHNALDRLRQVQADWIAYVLPTRAWRKVAPRPVREGAMVLLSGQAVRSGRRTGPAAVAAGPVEPGVTRRTGVPPVPGPPPRCASRFRSPARDGPPRRLAHDGTARDRTRSLCRIQDSTFTDLG
jgi:hypothetical protein